MALRRRPRKARGAPSLLTAEVEKRLIEATRASVPVDVAAQAAGIGRATFMRWLQRGRDEEDRLDQGHPPTELEQPYLELWQKIAKARADSATRGVLLIQRVAAGGALTERTVKRYKDPASGAEVEEETEKRTAPDWRAASWLLERQHRQHFGKEAMQVELTGADGGPVQLTGNVDAEELAKRVSANLRLSLGGAVAALPPGQDDDGIVDADEVDG